MLGQTLVVFSFLSFPIIGCFVFLYIAMSWGGGVARSMSRCASRSSMPGHVGRERGGLRPAQCFAFSSSGSNRRLTEFTQWRSSVGVGYFSPLKT